MEPQDDIDGQWTAATPDTVPGFSAVAFFFARKLHLDLGIPIGVIKYRVGWQTRGSPATAVRR